MQKKMPKKLCLVLCSTIISFCGCVTIPNTRTCTVAENLSRGMVCAESLTDKTFEMTLAETMEFLEPNAERAGALCESAVDWNKKKTALEQACRALGEQCGYEIQEALQKMQTPIQLQ